MRKTTRTKLQSPRDAPLISGSGEESFNSASLQTPLKIRENSMPCSHSGSGCNSDVGSMSPKHSVFVLDKEGKPLTPTTPNKARKLLSGGVAKPVWSKFGTFGVQMLVDTRKEHPKTVLGVDFGTKFEGYAVVSGKENNLAVMWKLPDKKKIVKKLEERSQLRRARRWRNCRRRECRSNNRARKNFLAPSQRVIVQSRLKVMNEFFKCYTIDVVALEDVCFNHRDHKWGANFSTVEIGKSMIKNWIRERACLDMFGGCDTGDCRERYGYKKSSNKSAEVFNAHCSDALAIAVEVGARMHVAQGRFIIADDTYRPVRRKLHDTQFAKGGVRDKYSTGNFKGVRKGTICEYGQVCGGTGNSFFIRNEENKRVSRVHLSWLSHKFKTHYGVKSGNSSPHQECGVSLPHDL
jgi:hypothetical protein